MVNTKYQRDPPERYGSVGPSYEDLTLWILDVHMDTSNTAIAKTKNCNCTLATAAICRPHASPQPYCVLLHRADKLISLNKNTSNGCSKIALCQTSEIEKTTPRTKKAVFARGKRLCCLHSINNAASRVRLSSPALRKFRNRNITYISINLFQHFCTQVDAQCCLSLL